MDKWIAAPDFIEADVITWTEAVFAKRGRKKARPTGERKITGEVLSKGADGWCVILVRSCIITKDESMAQPVVGIKPGTEVKRATKTILRGKPQRLLWEDESARDVVMARSPKSSFLAQTDK
jgi:hypothetical protein